jgi:CheY-like chemotaxis protein
MLPGLDGFGVMKAIRRDFWVGNLCVIGVNALAMPADREKVLPPVSRIISLNLSLRAT